MDQYSLSEGTWKRVRKYHAMGMTQNEIEEATGVSFAAQVSILKQKHYQSVDKCTLVPLEHDGRLTLEDRYRSPANFRAANKDMLASLAIEDFQSPLSKGQRAVQYIGSILRGVSVPKPIFLDIADKFKNPSFL